MPTPPVHTCFRVLTSALAFLAIAACKPDANVAPAISDSPTELAARADGSCPRRGGKRRTDGCVSAPLPVTEPEPTPEPLEPPPVVAAEEPTSEPVEPPPVVAPQEPTGTSPGRPIPAAPSNAGSSEFRVRTMLPGTVPPSPTNVGAFRNPCSYSHMAFDDPIVYPGQPGASHLHVFFGNTSTNAYTTTESLAAANRSTCAGGSANLSAYWVPAMVDTNTGKALIPYENIFYYKKGYNDMPTAALRDLPQGLRIIAGNKATATEPLTWFQTTTYECNDEYATRSQGIPYCPSGGYINQGLLFPNCWDGVNLDSPDHRSHMVYADFQPDRKCPASHPVLLPEIALNIKYRVESGMDTRKWRLSSDNYDTSKPGGYSMHGDIWVNWTGGISATWAEHCLRRSQDCHGFLLGDGRELY